MTTAQSSHLQSYDYDGDTSTLVIQFTNGAIYQYAGVPVNIYYTLAQSPSPGTYFWSHIRDRFPSQMISPGQGRGR